MNIKTIDVNGVIPMNCYVVSDDNNNGFMVDPGGDIEKIQSYVSENNITIEAILLTHAHIDHIIALNVYDVPVYLSRDENEFELSDDANNGRDLWEKYFGVKKLWQYENLNIKCLEHLQTFNIGSFEVKALLTPGHSFGDMTYIVNNEVGFVGDCLFINGVGRWDYPVGCDLEKLANSVNVISENVDHDMILYSGHRDYFSINQIRHSNPYYDIFVNADELTKEQWIKQNNIQLKDWNEYAQVTFGMSFDDMLREKK